MKNILILTVLAALAIACQNSGLGEGGVPMTDGNFDTSGLFGGEKVKSSNPIAKSVVAIRIHKTNGNWLTCTGFLIQPRLVLTNAHCFDAKYSEALVYFTTDFNFPSKDDTRTVVDKRMHEEYDGHESDLGARDPHDVVLLKLNKSAPAKAAPITLAGKDFDYESLETVKAAGYGATSLSKSTREQKGLDKVLRAGTIGVTKADSPLYYHNSPGNPILFLDQSHGTGLCAGDSGSALMVEQDGELIAIGLHEGSSEDGPGDNACSGSSSAIKLSGLSDWIAQKSAELSR